MDNILPVEYNGDLTTILHIHGEHIAITIGSLQWQFNGLHPNQWMTLIWFPGGSCMYKWYSLHVYTFAQIKFVYLYMYVTVYIYKWTVHCNQPCFGYLLLWSFGEQTPFDFPLLTWAMERVNKIDGPYNIRSVWPRVLFDSLRINPHCIPSVLFLPKDSILSPWKLDQFPPQKAHFLIMFSVFSPFSTRNSTMIYPLVN